MSTARRCWQAIFTGSGAGTPPPVHTAMALMRRQSTWSSIVHLMSRPEGTSGRQNSSTRTHDASGTSWNGLGRWPAPLTGNERERGPKLKRFLPERTHGPRILSTTIADVMWFYFLLAVNIAHYCKLCRCQIIWFLASCLFNIITEHCSILFWP